MDLYVTMRNRPHVTRWFGGSITLEKVREKFRDRLGSPHYSPFIVEREGDSIAYVQHYVVSVFAEHPWQREIESHVVGIDLFLFDERSLDRGLGSALLTALLERLRHAGVTKVLIDPSIDNARAIRCYEKVGFRRSFEVQYPWGTEVVMLQTLGSTPHDKP